MIGQQPRSSVRRLARNASVVTLCITVLLTATLLARTLILMRANQRVADAATGAAVAPELEADFRAHERLSGLSGTTNDPQVQEQLQSAQSQAMWLSELSLAIGFASLFVMIFTLYIFMRRLRTQLLEPLETFSVAIERLGAGESDARVGDQVPEELAKVATAFNSMADALEWQRQNELAYLAAVAHDLRNPLAALKTGVAIVQKKTGKPDGMAGTFAAIDRQIDRLSRMVGDLLDMVRIEAGKLELRREPIDLRSAVRDQVEFYRPTTDKHELVARIPDEPALCNCDPMRVEQLLGNLIINAIKYSPQGGRVEVTLKLEADELVISVEDEGVGMPKDALEKIFAPFWRRRMEGRIEGAGLGLSVVRRIVEAHGGKVEVESEPHLGSVFRVRLPRLRQAAAHSGFGPPSLEA